MTPIRTFARAGYHQARNISRLLSGESLAIASLNSTTLDEDDVQVAEYWLDNQENWYESATVDQFQNQFAAWNESKYAFGFMGGRVALSSIIYALGLQPGDEVILPGYTCIVVPNAFHYAGIKTVYSDIELETYGLDASLLQPKITGNTKAILLHHLYGLVSRDYEEILYIARQNNLFVIEDCAHSLGTEFKGKKVGNLGDAAFFSTERSKVMTTIQGGMAVTNNDSIAEKIKEYLTKANEPDSEWIKKLLQNVALAYVDAKHPQRWWKTDWNSIRQRNSILISTTAEEERGIRPANYGRTMAAPVAALGLNQLRKVDSYNARRRDNAKRWDIWCEQSGYAKPLVISESKPIFLRYPVIVEEEKKRDRTWARKQLQVDLGVWFKTQAHPAPLKIEGCPNGEIAVRQCVNFPTIIE